MKRIIKTKDSIILKKNIKYKTAGRNQKLKKVLQFEQNCFCAYHEKYLGEEGGEIDHFNPTLKGKKEDTYYNWFLINSQLNKEKSRTWYQPILHPTAIDFEDRLIYKDGRYKPAKFGDKAVQNLINLLKLNKESLVKERMRFVNRQRRLIRQSTQTPQEFFNEMLQDDISDIRFLRVIKKEFGVTLNLKNNLM